MWTTGESSLSLLLFSPCRVWLQWTSQMTPAWSQEASLTPQYGCGASRRKSSARSSPQQVQCATVTNATRLDVILTFYNTFFFSFSLSQDLNLIDKESDDVLERIMDERTASESKILYGHSGPVYGISFSPDRYHHNNIFIYIALIKTKLHSAWYRKQRTH